MTSTPNQTHTPVVTITPKASGYLRELIAEHGPAAASENGAAAEEQGLRIFVEKGGCAGMQYGMKLDAPRQGDEVVPLPDGRNGVVVDAESARYLRGCQIDYSESLNDAGFKIVNPNAVRSCGCGTSFETADSPAPDPNASCS